MYLKAGTLGPMSVERGCCSKLAKPRNFKPRSFLPSVYSLTQQIVLKHLVKDIKPLAIHRALFHQFVTRPRMFGPFQEAELLLLRACLRQRSPLPDPFEAHTPPCCCPLLPSLHSLNTLPPDLVFLSTTTLDDLNVHPSNPLVFLGFVILFCLQWSSLTSCSHCKVTPWIVLHRELALLISLIQASWSQASIFSPSQAACSTTPSRSELSSDCPLGLSTVFPTLCVAFTSLPIQFKYRRTLFQQLNFNNYSAIVLCSSQTYLAKLQVISIFCASVPRHQGVTREGNRNKTTRGKFSVSFSITN